MYGKHEILLNFIDNAYQIKWNNCNIGQIDLYDFSGFDVPLPKKTFDNRMP